MKNFLKSAFALNLMVILMFLGMAYLSYLNNIVECEIFFSLSSFVFLIMLPMCSTKN